MPDLFGGHEILTDRWILVTFLQQMQSSMRLCIFGQGTPGGKYDYIMCAEMRVLL